jgi:hypothetical protein
MSITRQLIAGLDLGQAQDYSALAVLERQEKDGQAQYLLNHLRRWALGTPYTVIAADLGELFCHRRQGDKETPPLAGAPLAVDQTGVGRAVVDMIRDAGLYAQLSPVLITAGHATTYGEDGAWHVPKKELVSTLQVLLQGARLKIARVPDREVLVKELLAFRVKVTAAGNETFESWRERDHDDLVLAVALAAWMAENGPSQAEREAMPMCLETGPEGRFPLPERWRAGLAW